jgi:hypothetical protein
MKIEPIKSLFTKGKMSKDCFENYPVKATDYPNLTKAMDAALLLNQTTAHLKPITEPPSGAEVGRGMIEFQWHRASIDEHTDDVDEDVFFQMYVVDLINKIDSYSDKRPYFSCYNSHKEKMTCRLEKHSTVIFAPRYEHSMVYYGAEYLVAIRSVYKG